MSLEERPAIRPRARELGAFLRTRRERLTPADVGLPGGGRRRVTGLRREEVAVLAHVGTTWYTWLEQGRDVHPSVGVLDALADGLMLDDDERRHLFALGGHADAADTGAACGRLGPRMQAVLDAFLPYPAVVMGPKFDAVGYNRAFRFLVDDIEAIPQADRNCAYLHFTHPAWIAGHADHEAECALIVARLRTYYADSLDDPAWVPLLARLREDSPLFGRLWDRGDVALDTDHIKTVRSVRVGDVRLHATTTALAENVRLRLILYTPADDASQAALARLDALLDAPVDAPVEAPPDGDPS